MTKEAIVRDDFSKVSCKRAGRASMPLVIGLAMCVVLVGLFAVVARQALKDNARQEKGRNDFDDGWAQDMRTVSEQQPVVRGAMVVATHMGGVPAMMGMVAAGALWQWWRGRGKLALAWCCIAAGGGLLNQAMKVSFDRDRPPPAWRDGAATETNKSFPSGHSMGSAIGYGLLAYMGTWRRRFGVRSGLVAAGLSSPVPFIGFSRIFLRAHWFTDVVGGFLIGGAWLALCLGFMEHWRSPRTES